ncbi:MAG: decarboxylase [Nanoarchaeota archaeon]|nr:decarboxylase [Nanoarchaeota archaeon]
MKPKFTLSKSIVLSQYKKVQEVSDITSYSSKTNPLITPFLEQETDCLFSIHIKNELKNIKDKSRVLFFVQGWNQEDLKELLEQNITFFVIDNESDLDVLLEFIEKNNVNIKLLLRMRLKERSLRTERHFVFGMMSDVINKRIKQLKNNKNIETLGIHFHRKTQNLSEWNLRFELEQVLEKETLQSIKVINIGGGLPSMYANTNKDVVNLVLKKITELKEWFNSLNIKMMIEPGRFIAAPAGKLITQIISIHEDNIIINASVYNTDMDALIVPVKLLIENELPIGQGKPYKVKGKTPCSMDLFRYKVYLEKPKVGNTLTFINAGAYNFTTDFCELEKLDTEIID